MTSQCCNVIGRRHDSKFALGCSTDAAQVARFSFWMSRMTLCSVGQAPSGLGSCVALNRGFPTVFMLLRRFWIPRSCKTIKAFIKVFHSRSDSISKRPRYTLLLVGDKSEDSLSSGGRPTSSKYFSTVSSHKAVRFWDSRPIKRRYFGRAEQFPQ